ncbi:hypothetical protein HDU76_007981, partial [Blyttiomyces sp. JEL0837]
MISSKRSLAAKPQQTVFTAAYEGNLDTVRSLVEAQPTLIFSIDEDERTALHWAASGSRVHIAEYLLEKGSKVDVQDDAKWTPLMIAVSVGNGPMTDLLLQKGADPNLANENQQTPLFYAASKGWTDISSMLLSHGAKLNSKDHLWQTPLYRAAAKGNIAVVRLFLENGNLKLDIEDKLGNTPLHVAIENGH